MKEQWNKFLSENHICVVLDTETSGLSEYDNDILSLSWQVIKTSTWEVVSSENIYFQWSSKDRVSKKAIQINGLTTERLRELGTIDRKKGMEMFSKAVVNSDLVVGHNVTFDMGFIDATIERLGMNPIEWPTVFDTMKPMSIYFGKWPKLEELVDFLDIDDYDIDYHQSSSDVEVTKRCFKKIAEGNLLPLPKIKKTTPKKKETDKKVSEKEDFSKADINKKNPIINTESLPKNGYNFESLLESLESRESMISIAEIFNTESGEYITERHGRKHDLKDSKNTSSLIAIGLIILAILAIASLILL